MNRAAFESWISAPPYERDVARWEPRHAWPGQYRDITVQVAWEAWQASVAARERVQDDDIDPKECNGD